MSLEAGRKLAHYEILAPIGQGGMGVVYRARDTKLGREVAIKVLPEEFTEHEQKLARFEREAKLLAVLNHPKIATLYGVEDIDKQPLLIMELVEGETLAERIARGPIPVDEAFAIALQIAEALEAAHEKGVIHRDLKPSNTKIDAEGNVKVLDFGLAKAFADEVPESELSQSPTLSRDATRAGVILGTAAYMSPEQAKGKAVDKRSDIFSFGIVLYEMLTGKKAFAGEDVSDVLAAIIRAEPDWSELPFDLDPRVESLLRRCLRKDRKKRLQAMGDARNEIEDILAEPRTQLAPAAAPSRKRVLSWALNGVLGVALLLALWRPWASDAPLETPVRLSVDVTAGDSYLYTSGGGMPALSPDGKMLAFVGQSLPTQIHIRPLDSLETTPLSGTEFGVAPFFSPDGRWLAFGTVDSSLKKVSVSGGAVLPVLEEVGTRGGTWGPDDTIVYGTPEAGLYRVPASGGTPVQLTTLREGESSHRLPSFLPNGRALLFTVQPQNGSFDDATIEALVLETGQRKVLHRGGTKPRYASSGHLVFARADVLFAMPFDADRVEVTGEPSPVIEGVGGYAPEGGANFDVADDGTLVYIPAEVSAESARRELVWVDREGNASPVIETLGDWESPRLSPDGTRLAVRRLDETGQQVWLLDLYRGALTKLTFEWGILPLWSPDGERVFFGSSAGGDGAPPYDIYSISADGSGSAEQLTAGAYRMPSSITSDGKTIVFRQGGAGENLDIGILNREDGGEPELILDTSYDEHTGMLSPDDRWLAYVSNESGREEIYVTPFPVGRKVQISTEGGREPMWSRDGRELFYRNGEKMMAVDFSAEADLLGRPTLLFEGPYDLKDGPGASNYDVAEDGRFVMILTRARSSGQTHVILVQNWFTELERLAPAN